jgi:hypothetical protein
MILRRAARTNRSRGLRSLRFLLSRPLPSVSFRACHAVAWRRRVFRGWPLSRSLFHTSPRLRLACVYFAYFVVISLSPAQSVPPYINYQGRVTDAGGVPWTNGMYAMSVCIYTNRVGGEPVWGPQKWGEAEDGPGRARARVPVVGGYFSLVLGEHDIHTNDLGDAFVGGEAWTEVVCDRFTNERQRVLSVPYALRAGKGGLSELLTYSTDTNARVRFVRIETQDGTNSPGKLRHYVLRGCAGGAGELVHSEIMFDTAKLADAQSLDLTRNFHSPTAYVETGRNDLITLQLHVEDASDLSLTLFGMPTTRGVYYPDEYHAIATNAFGGEYGLVAYYPLDEDASDHSGNGMDGSVRGNVHFRELGVRGKGNAASFDGVAESFVEVPWDEITGFKNSESFSVSMWILVADNSSFYRRLLTLRPTGEDEPGGNPWFFFNKQPSVNPNGLHVAMGRVPHTYVHSTKRPGQVVGQWVHIAGVVDARVGVRTLSLYVDGLFDDASPGVADYDFSTVGNLTLYIGGGYLGTAHQNSNGRIDDVRVYRRALSAWDVKRIYGKGP